MPSTDEAEVFRTIQTCLEMRESYMFRETVAPWERENLHDSSSLKPNQNPFDYTPEEKSEVSLRFVHLFGSVTVVSFVECITVEAVIS